MTCRKPARAGPGHLCAIVALLLTCGVRPAVASEDITVFAAAGVADALTEAAQRHQATTGVRVQLSFGSSSVMAHQITEGARADIFVSANSMWMDYVQDRGLMQDETRISLAEDRLALITPADGMLSIDLVPGTNIAGAFEGRLSLGDPGHVPAGMYAREALRFLGAWDALSGRLAPSPDVRTAARMVALREANAGVVFISSALATPGVRIAAVFPENSHSPIQFTVALCQQANLEAAPFLAYLLSEEGQAIFKKHGFGAPGSGSALAVHREDIVATDHARVARDAFWVSLKVGFGAVLGLLVPGIFCGWLLARCSFMGKTLFEGLINLPLVAPPVVTGYMLLLLLGRNGLIGGLLDRVFGFQLAFSWWGAVLAAMAMAFPLMVRSVRLGIEMVDRDLEEASGALGAGPLRRFFTVTLPLAAPGIITGVVLAFARSLGEFGATIVFAGNIQGVTQTLPLAIYSRLQVAGGETAAAWLVALSISLSLGALVMSQALTHRYRQAP